MLKKYEDYKETQISYLGSLPSHWNILPLRSILFERKEKNIGKKNNEILSVMANRGVILYSEKGNVGNKASDNIERYNVVYEDDIVLNCMNVIIGSVGRSPYNGVLSPVYYVLVNRNTQTYNTRYYDYVFKLKPLQSELKKYGKGILAHRMRISMDSLKSLNLPCPPIEEQNQVVKYLDWKLSKINKLIRAKKRLIYLMNEQKQAIINQAVTMGLNPDSALKDSDIELFDKIPSNWKLLRLGQCIKKIEQGWSPTASEGELDRDQWAVLSLSSISKGIFYPEAIKPIDTNSAVPSVLEIAEGDLLLTRSNTRELVGDTCIVRNPRPKTIICDLIYRLSLYEDIALPEYISYFLLSSYGRQQIEQDARGSSGTMPKISHKHIRSWIIPLPPVSEQKSLIVYINNKIDPLINAIETTKLSVEAIQEYRTRLISDVVTGKVDVRDIEIPEYEADSDETIDDEIDDNLVLDEEDGEMVVE